MFIDRGRALLGKFQTHHTYGKNVCVKNNGTGKKLCVVRAEFDAADDEIKKKKTFKMYDQNIFYTK